MARVSALWFASPRYPESHRSLNRCAFARRLLIKVTQKLKSDPICFQGRLIAVRNLRIFVFVWNHPAALFHSPEHVVIGFLMRDFESEREETATIADRQMACRLLPGIEMLVKPIPWRAVDTALAPLD